ncbi:MAG TPA: glycerol-3-phosphate dehydrogenase/oxidase [Terriglobia bacterium]|nr:glycerol-3-phosphate dehydrogenase/oxidase [Terriglobia bacterium]
MTREERLAVIRRRPEVSVLIVGGGINGAGLLRELALEGVDALLVDKTDFASGASSASTRIIHGGLRYLENGEFRLVRESLRERNRLLKNAPHYVGPLPTTIPIFSWAKGLFSAPARFLGLKVRPSDRGALLIKIGLSLYDLLTGKQAVLPTHQFKSRHVSLAARPQLNPEIVCTAVYYDAWISYPERLCVELVLDAGSQCSAAQALNYVCLENAHGDTVVLEDQVGGQRFEIKPRIVVNATGAWIDFTNRALGRQSQYIGGTKGSHLVLQHAELLAATQGQMLYFANADGRICIFYPYYGKVMAGSTDIPVSDPETALCDEDEVDYILESMRQIFPAIQVDRSHIVYRFCGVRPLPRSDASTPGEISRDHSCEIIPAGNGIDFPIYSLIGGKWTTFRAFGEQVADRILHHLARSRSASSADLPIGGGKGYPTTSAAKIAWLASLQDKTHLPAQRLGALLDRYGTRAEDVAEFICAGPDQPLRSLPEYTRREVQFMASQESIVHLDDLILRRTIMALLGQLSHDLLEELAGVLAPELAWSPERTEQEIARTVELLSKVHGIRL